ncbi:outer membrane beta-barrel protein [Colwelliaceae bacterium BS250]
MNIKFITLSILVSSVLSAYSSTAVADNGVYLGAGLSNLDLDGDSSVNVSITTGYNFLKQSFDSADIQALTLGVEVQYSDSISGTDNVNNYSIFTAFRAYISDLWYFKVKYGYTDFPDITLIKSDAENSHIGAGIGLGYRMNSGSFELEYVYPNKTIDASIIEFSYKYHF